MRLSNIISQYWLNIQGVLFPSLKEKLGKLTEGHKQVILTLEVVRIEEFIKYYSGYRGRPLKDRAPIARSFVAKSVLNLPTTRSLLDRLNADSVLRRICGWESRIAIPDESTFSRAFNEFSKSQLPERVHEALIKKNFKDNGQLVGHISRDSTKIVGRERPKKLNSSTEKKSAKSKKSKKSKRRRGRPRKGEEVKKEPTRLERQLTMNLEEMLADLPKECDRGSKKGSKGYKETWIGYKFHIDAADGQIPISCILTSASLHDNQAAIPLSEMSKDRITNLYDLMDSGYDSAIIKEYSRSLGHIPIIEVNPRRNTQLREELKAESTRLEILNIQYPESVRYNERTNVERVNGRLKNEFGGEMIRVRGNAKVVTHLMFGILALTVDQLMRFIM